MPLKHSHVILLLGFSERVLLNPKVLVIVCKLFNELLLIGILTALIIQFGGLYATNDTNFIAFFILYVNHLCIGVPSFEFSQVLAVIWFFLSIVVD